MDAALARFRRPSRALAALAALAVAALLFACATPLPTPRETGLLVFWDVRSATNPESRVWLLGSVHVARPELRLDGRILDAFRSSDALVLEVDTSATDPAEMQRIMQQYALIDDGTTLEELVGPETWNRLGSFLRARGAPPEAFQHYEPWFMLTVLSTALFAESGADRGSGIETRLLASLGPRKPVISLESMEYQFELLRSLPRPLAVSMLDAMLRNQDTTRDVGDLVLDAWEAGDLDLIARIALPDPEGDPDLEEYQERTFFARNRRMAEGIGGLLAKPGTWFVAVGAAHMAGPEGIPRLLEAAGHSVTRVPRSVER